MKHTKKQIVIELSLFAVIGLIMVSLLMFPLYKSMPLWAFLTSYILLIIAALATVGLIALESYLNNF